MTQNPTSQPPTPTGGSASNPNPNQQQAQAPAPAAANAPAPASNAPAPATQAPAPAAANAPAPASSAPAPTSSAPAPATASSSNAAPSNVSFTPDQLTQLLAVLAQANARPANTKKDMVALMPMVFGLAVARMVLEWNQSPSIVTATLQGLTSRPSTTSKTSMSNARRA